MASLETEDAGALLDQITFGYWSEHSERAGIDTWLAAVGVGPEQRNFVGRWAVKGSADIYARTAVRITENLQGKAATYAQITYAGGADYFGEEHALCEMGAWLLKRGAKAEQIEDQKLRLTLADCALAVNDYGSNREEDDPSHASPPLSSPPLSPSRSSCPSASPFDGLPPAELSWRALAEPDSSGESGCRSSATISCRSGGTSVVVSDEADEDSSEESPDPDFEEAQGLYKAERDREKPHGFVVVRTDKGRMRRLHFVGSCYRVPDEHYRDYTVWGDQLPDSSEIDARCKQCFKEDKVLLSRPQSGPLSDVSSADEADTSSNSGSTCARSRSPTPTPVLRGHPQPNTPRESASAQRLPEASA